ncbi:hypothetical protein [Aquibacillus sediminis]|uniref:hypothetical protein n=1 Tax=Aquibacillus sediminis TaxID=2574734 RepID=UPI001107ED9C|nr:hypothetical protein [Aquibacillus sediminis]
MKGHLQIKLLGVIGIIGSVLFVLFTILHPPTFNPWNSTDTFEKVSHHSFWVIDHIFITIGLVFWLVGLSAAKVVIHEHGILKTVGSSMFLLSLGIWIIIMTFEIGIIPMLVHAIEQHQSEVLLTFWFVIFGFGLLAGYFAFIFTWIGVLLYSLALQKEKFPKWFRLSGVWSSLLGVLGIIISLLYMDYVIIILGLTSGPPFIWTIILLRFMMRHKSDHAIHFS